MEFQKGMDLSFIPELEDAGVQVKDFDGTEYCVKHSKFLPEFFIFLSIQSPISIPLTLHRDVASRHMKFQKNRSFMQA